MKIYVAVVVIVLVNVAGVGAVGNGKLTQEDKDYLVKGHNDERRSQGASNMYKLVSTDGLIERMCFGSSKTKNRRTGFLNFIVVQLVCCLLVSILLL